LFEAVEQDIGMRMWPAIRQWWPYVDYHGLRDVFVIRYAMGEQEELRMHHDIAQVSASIKLNDDYEGAELVFPRQEFSNDAVPVGDMVVWPSLVTHPHESKPLRSGVKYSLTVWCELPLPIDGARMY
jgi:predicted 2-oxoglutarate/Fe(II)-dependent dioxygenase YbiX